MTVILCICFEKYPPRNRVMKRQKQKKDICITKTKNDGSPCFCRICFSNFFCFYPSTETTPITERKLRKKMFFEKNNRVTQKQVKQKEIIWIELCRLLN
jgi:hypothetical protein